MQEVISLPGLKLVENDEFSESGRGVYPDGLYRLLMQFHHRYKRHGFSYIITENGVSDESDYIRRPYLVEHLLAVREAMNQVCRLACRNLDGSLASLRGLAHFNGH